MATTTTTEKTWLGIMPTIPLARGVPIIDTKGGERGVCVFADWPMLKVYRKFSDGRAFAIDYSTAGKGGYFRVDLDDPQGLAYAARFVGSRVDSGPHYALVKRVALNLLFGIEIADTDRLALAHACAEMAS